MSFPLVGNLSSLFFRKGSEGVVIKKNSGQARMTYKEINITLIGGRHAEKYCRKDF
jgi:hypothetical protein